MIYGKLDASKPTEKSKQEPVWKVPLDISRRQTDFMYIVAFAICFISWIAAGIYAFCAGHKDYILFDRYALRRLTFGIYPTLQIIFVNIGEYKDPIFVFCLVSIAVLFIYMLTFRWITKFVVILTMILPLAHMTLLYGASIGLIIQASRGEELLAFTILLSIFYLLTLIALFKVGMNTVCKHLKESCEAMLFFPSAMLCTAVQFTLLIVLFCYFVAVYAFLHTVDLPDVDVVKENIDLETDYDDPIIYKHFGKVPPYCIYILHFINVFAYVWTTFFVVAFGRVVLTATFATWYRTEEKSSVPPTTLRQCFTTVLKYHLGTIAFAAFPFSMVLVWREVYAQGVEKLKQVYKRPLCLIFWLVTMIKLRYDALFQSAVYGEDYRKSIKNSYDLIMKDPVASLPIDYLSDGIIFYAALIMVLLPFNTVVLYNDFCHIFSRDAIYSTVCVAIFFSIMTSGAVFMAIRTASSTFRFCCLEDSKFGQEAEVKLDQICIDNNDKDINCNSEKPLIVDE